MMALIKKKSIRKRGASAKSVCSFLTREKRLDAARPHKKINSWGWKERVQLDLKRAKITNGGVKKWSVKRREKGKRKKIVERNNC